jgi:flagellar basal-body rod modification protein FlgD
MTNTAVAPTNAAQAGYSSSGTNGTSGTNSTASTSTASASALSANAGLASLADNFQGFLTLLTTQLKNQDPTTPLDTNQFTSQITQMTGVEQQLLSNKLLQQLVTQQTGVGAAANLIGDTVTAPGATASAAAISGTVTAVSQTNGATMLTVGGNQVALSALTSVTSNANSLSSLLGG